MAEAAVNDRVLAVDLTQGITGDIRVTEQDRRDYLGGKGLALKLIHDRLGPGVDPLSPENILALMSGPAAATAAPAGGRFAVVGKSPLTGIYASSYTGGRFGVALKRAGYDGVLIQGKSPEPVYLSISDGQAVIKPAGDLWGLDTYEVQEARRDEGDWAVIGPAGENLVRYATICAGKRVAGRCGLGAVLGSKNLKGLVAQGNGKFGPADPRRFSRALGRARSKVKHHDMTGSKLPRLGTPQNVDIYGRTGIMPVRNFSRTSFEGRESIASAVIKEKHFVRNHGCVGCPVQCGRLGRFDQKVLVSPEYETIAMMGSNLLVADISQIALWNDQLNRLGLDSISTGCVLGFAMELTEKGMLDSRLSFGDPLGISEMITDIAYRRGLGNDLAEGVRRMAAKYGGQEFAIHVKGLEMAAYDPRGCSGQGLGYATANRGATHLSGSTHAIEAESYLSQHGTKGKAHFVKFMQDLTASINSCIFCIQTQYPFLEYNLAYRYTPMCLLGFMMRNIPALAVATADLSDYCGLMSGLLGFGITRGDFLRAGERIFNLERYLNTREGIGRADDTLPPRLLQQVREDGWPAIELEQMLDRYYRLRGWDPQGAPRPEVLQRLGISTNEGGHA